LKYADATPAQLEATAKDLLAAQRSDGGWAQTDELASDAYATGSALVALHQAGRLATDDPAYRRGLSFLLATQKPDGTWFVASRSRRFQLYFESGFPYGKDQFIAVAASGWAAAALALALPAEPTPVSRPSKGCDPEMNRAGPDPSPQGYRAHGED